MLCRGRFCFALSFDWCPFVALLKFIVLVQECRGRTLLFADFAVGGFDWCTFVALLKFIVLVQSAGGEPGRRLRLLTVPPCYPQPLTSVSLSVRCGDCEITLNFSQCINCGLWQSTFLLACRRYLHQGTLCCGWRRFMAYHSRVTLGLQRQ